MACIGMARRHALQIAPPRTFFAGTCASSSGRATALRHGHGHGEFEGAPTVKIIFKKDNKHGADPDGEEVIVDAPVTSTRSVFRRNPFLRATLPLQ